MTPPACPYCHETAKLASISETGVPFVHDRNIWRCYTPNCDSWIGVRRDDPLSRPIGTMANPELRALRNLVRQILRGGNGSGSISGPRFNKRLKEIAAQLGLRGKLNVSALSKPQCLAALKIINPEGTGSTNTKEVTHWLKD